LSENAAKREGRWQVTIKRGNSGKQKKKHEKRILKITVGSTNIRLPTLRVLLYTEREGGRPERRLQAPNRNGKRGRPGGRPKG